jgi:hypothetical protein
LKEKPA